MARMCCLGVVFIVVAFRIAAETNFDRSCEGGGNGGRTFVDDAR
jgi:hypothetical protein